MKLTLREVWNDIVGMILCLVGMVGLYHKVDYSGWLLFFGFLFFCASPSDKDEAEDAEKKEPA